MRGSAIAQTIATVPGFNWFLIDAEHGQIGDADYYEVGLLPPILLLYFPHKTSRRAHAGVNGDSCVRPSLTAISARSFGSRAMKPG
jgi:hypothetical protein